MNKKSSLYIIIFSFSVFFVFTLSSCSSLTKYASNRENVLTFERQWVRQTTQSEYLGARINQVMTPILFENIVIQGNEIDGLVAYNRKNGHKIWSKYIKGGVCANAKLEAETLYVGTGDGFFIALDARTGQMKWSYPIKSEGIGAPMLSQGAIYFIAGNNTAYALKASSGELLWSYSRAENAQLTIRGASEPSVDETHVYMGFSDGFLVSLTKDKGALVWEKQLSANTRFKDIDAKPVLEGDKIYISSYDGQLFCLKKINGSTVWTNENGGFSPVTIDNNVLYYATSDRKVLALEKSSGKIIWQKDVLNSVASQPVVYRNLVLYGEWSGSLRAVDKASGADLSHFTTGWGVTSSPAIDDKSGDLFMISADANLYSLKMVYKNSVDQKLH
jgi:outer membrane protein assembly factor BamB